MVRLVSLLVLGVVILTGCGDEGSVAKQTGDTIGQAATDFVTGVGSGVDKRMEVSVELTEKASGLGITKTVSKQLDIGQKGITVYLITQNPVKSQLIAKALNAEGQEVGRSVVDIDFSADDAKYVEFPFDQGVDMQLVDKFVVDVREQNTTEASKPDASGGKSAD